MKKYMTKKETLKLFRQGFRNVCPGKGHKCLDKPMRDQAWNDWTDGLIKDGMLHKRAYNWSHPFN